MKFLRGVLLDAVISVGFIVLTAMLIYTHCYHLDGIKDQTFGGTTAVLEERVTIFGTDIRWSRVVEKEPWTIILPAE